MDITVTLFKKKGDRSAEIFSGTSGNRTSVGEWQVLIRNRKLKDAGVKFLTIEFEEPQALLNGYANKVDKNIYIDLRWGTDVETSVAYPQGSPLKSQAIHKWILDTLKNPPEMPQDETPIVTPLASQSPSVAMMLDQMIQQPLLTPRAASALPTIQASVETEETPFVQTWGFPLALVGGLLGVGIVAGASTLLFKHFEESPVDEFPLRLTDDQDREVKDFESINWDQQVHPDRSNVIDVPFTGGSL